MLIASIDAEVHPWYWQFYLRRGRTEWASDQVSPHGHETHLECIDGFVYVGTWTYGSTTGVTIEVHDSEPAPAPADHAVEVLLDGDGDLALLNWDPDDAPVAQMGLSSGHMTLRGSWIGLEAVEQFPEREVAGTRPSPEVIRIQIWPSIQNSAKVLRSWSEDT